MPCSDSGSSAQAQSQSQPASPHASHTKHDSKAILEDLRTVSGSVIHGVSRMASEMTAVEDHEAHHKSHLEALYSDRTRTTDVLEVFFAGAHCDVGGGSVANDTRHALANIPLRWMIRQCFLAQTGIQFDAAKLKAIARIEPSCLWPEVKPRPAQLPLPSPAPITLINPHKHIATTLFSSPTAGDGDPHEPFVSEEHEDLVDALCPVYDQLAIAKWWWALEVLPMRERVQGLDGKWEKHTVMNWGRPRTRPHQKKRGIKIHRSVKLRMDAKELAYSPQLQLMVEPEWMD